ncbi:FAD-binding protein [Pseudomonas aeruginosa]|nr:FAD-binding protein [Pseudomonas aeruginosa]MCW5248920.1 FAD-binding protein [Pseudomonas aeruginosa]
MLVVGSGAAGLAAAVTATWHGRRVVLVEKATMCGQASRKASIRAAS